MPTSGTVSSNVTRHHQPRPRALSFRDGALVLGAAAALLWVLTIVAVMVDVALHDRLPDPVPEGLGLLAGTASIAAVALWLAHVLTREMDKLATRLGVGQAAELPPGLATQIYQLGQRSREPRSVN
jgi:hypothetical protein